MTIKRKPSAKRRPAQERRLLVYWKRRLLAEGVDRRRSYLLGTRRVLVAIDRFGMPPIAGRCHSGGRCRDHLLFPDPTRLAQGPPGRVFPSGGRCQDIPRRLLTQWPGSHTLIAIGGSRNSRHAHEDGRTAGNHRSAAAGGATVRRRWREGGGRAGLPQSVPRVSAAKAVFRFQHLRSSRWQDGKCSSWYRTGFASAGSAHSPVVLVTTRW